MWSGPRNLSTALMRSFGNRSDTAVVDAAALLAAPAPVLAALCAAVGLPFDDAMLTWEPGPRAEDGVWAPHWYAAVEASTGFGPPRDEPPVVPDRLLPLLERCL